MSTIITRAGKGSPLTNNEVDANFVNLNTDKVEKTAADITGGTINNTTVGATTPSTGVFTTLTAQNETLKGTGTNLLVQSSSLTTTWTQSNVTLTGGQTDPFGGTTAFTVNSGTAAGTQHSFFQATSYASNVFTLSIYAKAGTANYVGVYLSASNSGVIFNLATGSVSVNIGTPPSASSITAVSGAAGWYRCSITVSGAQSFSQFFISEDGTNLTFTGTSKTITVVAPQLEIGSVLNTYIPTTTTAVYGTPTLSFSGVASIGLQSDGSLYETSAGTGNVRFYTNNIGQEQARVSHTASAVNYVQVTGSATGADPVISTQGSDADRNLRLSAKGSGQVATTSSFLAHIAATNYIQLSGGASAVTVSAIGASTNIDLTLTSKGTGSVVSSINGGTFTTARDSANNRIQLRSNGNLGLFAQGGGAVGFYTNTAGDVLQMQVAHTASAVNYVQVTGAATTTNPVITGQGSDGEVGLDLGIRTGGFNFIRQRIGSTGFIDFSLNAAGSPALKTNITGSQVNYHQLTGSATGSGPIHSVAGSDTNIDLNLTTKGTGAVRFNTGSGEQVRIVNSTTSDYWVMQGNPTILYPDGTSANRNAALSSKGTSAVQLYTNGGNQLQLNVTHTASAVNYVQVTGAATGTGATISGQGSDTNVGLAIRGKGSGFVSIGQDTTTQFAVSRTSSAVNYFLASGGISGNAPTMSAFGSDTNISQVFQSKGTGAIDLAAGSSGVNISNGGTVTALTLTNSGSGYTSFPTLAISTPTTAGGVQTTASFTMRASPAATIASGGTGYTVGNVLTFTGGTFTSAIQVTVATVSSGVITGITSTAVGSYSVLPSNPISVTGGTGSGATFNQTWGIASTFTITNAGSGYVEQPTVTFSGGGGSGAAAYASVGSGTVVKSIGSTMSFVTPGGEQTRIIDAGTTTDYLQLQGGVGGSVNPSIQPSGSNANTNIRLASRGTGSVLLLTNSAYGQLQAVVAHTASAVNYVQVTGAATGNAPYFISQGSDTNVNLWYGTKGTGYHAFFTAGNGANVQFLIANTASAVNYVQTSGSTTGFGAKIFSAGSDTNIPLVLQPKGTGALQAQQTDSTATGGNARGANAIDLQTLRASASNVASAQLSTISGGQSNTASAYASTVSGGQFNLAQGNYNFIGGGASNTANSNFASSNSAIVSGQSNTANGFYNFVGAGFTNSGTSASAVTSQSATTNATTAVTLSASNASIRVGQYITGSSINTETYVAAVSGTSLTLSKNAANSSTSTLSFYTPHGVVVGGGNNQATGSYSFIGGGGDAGTAANRNVASGDWSTVGGGRNNTASGVGSFIGGGGTFAGGANANAASGAGSVVSGGASNTTSGFLASIAGGFANVATASGSSVSGGWSNTSNSSFATVIGGTYGTTRSINCLSVLPACDSPIVSSAGVSQMGFLVLARQTTDATATVLTSNASAASTTNQVILPNNSAYYFRGEVVSGVTGGGNTKGFFIEGVIKRGANAASTALVGTPTVTSNYADAGASAWTIAVTADTTNGGLAVTFTGQAGTTIRTVAQIRTTEMTF